MRGELNGRDSGSFVLPKNDEETKDRARCTVARRATSRLDYELLIEMLDIEPEDKTWL